MTWRYRRRRSDGDQLDTARWKRDDGEKVMLARPKRVGP
jgi:hypothetical protein